MYRFCVYYAKGTTGQHIADVYLPANGRDPADCKALACSMVPAPPAGYRVFSDFKPRSSLPPHTNHSDDDVFATCNIQDDFVNFADGSRVSMDRLRRIGRQRTHAALEAMVTSGEIAPGTTVNEVMTILAKSLEDNDAR